MFICKRVSHLREWLDQRRQAGLSIGFVPTMGALHEGHLSLVSENRRQTGTTCVSIFVNPRQFNNPNDLKNYPRPLETDIKALYGAKADVVFIPDVADMYPAEDPFQTTFDPGVLGETMEGEFRPGHFKGMVDVVYRLLRIVEPDAMFLGQKDFQQAAIITRMVKDTALPVRITICPTIRESNGLAMSSRNMRLSAHGKNEAALIYRELVKGKDSFAAGEPATTIIERMMSSCREHGLDPEYFEVIDGLTLQPVTYYAEAEYIVACCAVKVEDVRLIDNVTWKEQR
jgi:pantoate--beta-alanine ligase